MRSITFVAVLNAILIISLDQLPESKAFRPTKEHKEFELFNVEPLFPVSILHGELSLAHDMQTALKSNAVLA